MFNPTESYACSRRAERTQRQASRLFLAGLCCCGLVFACEADAAGTFITSNPQQSGAQENNATSPPQSGIFIGTDPQTGDSVISVTQPRQPQQPQPQIPYIVPEVHTTWPPRTDQGGFNQGGYNPGGSWQPNQPYPPRPPRPPYPPDMGSRPEPGRPTPSLPGDRPSPPPPGDRPTPPPGGNTPPPPGGPGSSGGPSGPGGPGDSSQLPPPPPPRPQPPAWNQPPYPPTGGQYGQGNPFVYQPGMKLPSRPYGDRPYAPAGPSGPIIVPPRRQ